MKNESAAKYHPEIAEAIEAAQTLARKLKALHAAFAEGEIDQEKYGDELETLYRHNANEIIAIIYNLHYKVSREGVRS